MILFQASTGQNQNQFVSWLNDNNQNLTNFGCGVMMECVRTLTEISIIINQRMHVLISLFLSLSKFADDTKLGSRVTNEEDCEMIQRDLDILVEWSYE